MYITLVMRDTSGWRCLKTSRPTASPFGESGIPMPEWRDQSIDRLRFLSRKRTSPSPGFLQDHDLKDRVVRSAIGEARVEENTMEPTLHLRLLGDFSLIYD